MKITDIGAVGADDVGKRERVTSSVFDHLYRSALDRFGQLPERHRVMPPPKGYDEMVEGFVCPHSAWRSANQLKQEVLRRLGEGLYAPTVYGIVADPSHDTARAAEALDVIAAREATARAERRRFLHDTAQGGGVLAPVSDECAALIDWHRASVMTSDDTWRRWGAPSTKWAEDVLTGWRVPATEPHPQTGEDTWEQQMLYMLTAAGEPLTPEQIARRARLGLIQAARDAEKTRNINRATADGYFRRWAPARDPFHKTMMYRSDERGWSSFRWTQKHKGSAWA